MISSSDMKRIQKIQEGRWFSHPSAARVLEELELVYHQPKIPGAPIGRSIIGPSGAGKTTLLKHFVELHQSDSNQCPPLFIDLSSGPNLNSLLTNVLEGVNDFKASAGTASQKSNRVQRILKEIKPPMIIFDEAQDLAEGTDTQTRTCINEIKKISNKPGIPTIIAGTDDLTPLVRKTNQYGRRWRPIKLESYPENQDFVDLVNAFLIDVDLKKQNGFLAPTAYNKLYKYSEGTIGLIKEILINATIEAIRDGAEKITTNNIRPIVNID